MKEAQKQGQKARWKQKDLQTAILSYIRSGSHADGAKQQRHRRVHRPARIAEWISRLLGAKPFHHISSYSIQPLLGHFVRLGSLQEAGRETAKLPPPIGRDFCGSRCPAQTHRNNPNLDSNSSLLVERARSTSSTPTRPKTGKNRRGIRGEAAKLQRRESNRAKRAQRRREYRHIRSRWKGLDWEDPSPDLHLETLVSQDPIPTSQPANVKNDRKTHKQPPPLPPPNTPPPLREASKETSSSSSSSSSLGLSPEPEDSLPSRLLSSSASSSSSTSSSSSSSSYTTSSSTAFSPHALLRWTQGDSCQRPDSNGAAKRTDRDEAWTQHLRSMQDPGAMRVLCRELHAQASNRDEAWVEDRNKGPNARRVQCSEPRERELVPKSSVPLTAFEKRMQRIHKNSIAEGKQVSCSTSLNSLDKLKISGTLSDHSHSPLTPPAGVIISHHIPSNSSEKSAIPVHTTCLPHEGHIISHHIPSNSEEDERRAMPPNITDLPQEGLIISHHIPSQLPKTADIPTYRRTPEIPQGLRLTAQKLRLGTYNIRGLKRIGRQCEISHLMTEGKFDFLGIQETKSTGNTIQTLAEGFLLNSSDNPHPGKEEHRGTGLVFRKNFATALYKIYQGSSRWCGALFYGLPLPLLILSVYAPTAAASTDDKNLFYQQLGQIMAENAGAYTVILGDFNARILKDPGLPRHVGNHFFETEENLDSYSEDILENRDMFLDVLLQHDMVALNTLRPVTGPENKITYRFPGRPHFEPPWDPEGFAQIDYILTKARWKNDFANVQTMPHLDYDSDHLPVKAQMSITWKYGKQQSNTTKIKHKRQCTQDEKTEYNHQLGQQHLEWHTIQELVQTTAFATRGTLPPRAKKPYLTAPTLALLSERDEALKRGQLAHSKLLTTLFRRQVKKDKKAHTTEMLRTFEGAKQNWPAIKKLRSTFIPRFSKRGNQKASIPSNFPNDCADFFATKHWKGVTPTQTATPQPLYPQIADEGPFTIEELNQAIDTLKKNKTGGPDELITELFQDMNPANRTRLLELYNEIYDTESIPDHFNEALVVQIYKPGKVPENYSSYRPIALLNITYKILAKLIQERLRTSLDERIVEFQFGYRRGKSTAEPIFIARRVQELAEKYGCPLYMLALDYSKAFDSIPHEKLTESLQRKGASSKNIRIIRNLYRNPRFRIKVPEGISEEKEQQIGIRQGCPLSPYLYIIATSCLMEDLLADYRRTDIIPPEGATYPTLLFADDTLLLTSTAEQMTTLLALTINHSDPYNLQLNKDKCQLLITNGWGRVTFPDGTPVPQSTTIKYLGTLFSSTLDVGQIVRHKLTEAAATLRILLPLWTDPQIGTAWKLIVFNAVMRSRIFYTLETLELTPSHQRTLDTLFFRGLRKILGKPSTFVDRTWTHERLLALANAMASRAHPTATKHQSFSKYYKIRRRKLLGHLLRAPNSNICRLAILTPEDQDISDTRRRKRVGRPRFTWTQEGLKEAWAEISAEPFQTGQAIRHLKDLATRRTAPFNI